MAEGPHLEDLVEFPNGDTYIPPDPSDIVTARLERLENTRVKFAGGAELEEPDPRVIEILTRLDPKIKYFKPEIPKEAMEDTGMRIISELEYWQLITEPLTRKLSEEWKGKKKMLALRGAATSLNGTQVLEQVTVQDITSLLSSGNERGCGEMNVAPFDPIEDVDVIDLGTSRVNQYLHSTAMMRKFQLGDEIGNNVFPVVMVYDADQLKRTGGYWGATFRDPGNASAALLEVYIVDCPVLPA